MIRLFAILFFAFCATVRATAREVVTHYVILDRNCYQAETECYRAFEKMVLLKLHEGYSLYGTLQVSRANGYVYVARELVKYSSPLDCN